MNIRIKTKSQKQEVDWSVPLGCHHPLMQIVTNRMTMNIEIVRKVIGISWVFLWGCSLNVFVFLLVKSCLLISLVKCLIGHKSLPKCIWHFHCLCLFFGQGRSHHHSDHMSQGWRAYREGPLLLRLGSTGLGSFRLGNWLDWDHSEWPKWD